MCAINEILFEDLEARVLSLLRLELIERLPDAILNMASRALVPGFADFAQAVLRTCVNVRVNV